MVVPAFSAVTLISLGTIALAHADQNIDHARAWIFSLMGFGLIAVASLTIAYASTSKAASAFLSAALSDSTDLVLIIRNNRVAGANGDTQSVLGLPIEAVVGANLEHVLADEQDRFRSLVKLAATKPGTGVKGGVIDWTTPHGGQRSIDVTLADHRSNKAVRALIATISDRTAEMELQVRLAKAAASDPVTQLPNGTRFRELLNIAVHRARRTGEHLAVLSVVVDGIEGLRAAYGDDALEAAFMQLAERLNEALRVEDIVGRISADEFGVVLAGLAPKIGRAYAVDVADRIVSGTNEPFVVEGQSIKIAVSIGIAHRAKGVADPTAAELIAEAHSAMLEVRANAQRWSDLHPA
jgi:diguanylate cyclase (GGDEF)-like protein